MGTGVVYWLMLIHVATFTGWIFLSLHNLSISRIIFAVGCLVTALHFLIISYNLFLDYTVHQQQMLGAPRKFLSALFGLCGTFIFVIYINNYTPQGQTKMVRIRRVNKKKQ